VVPAIANLRRAGRLTYRGLLSCPEETLADLIRPAGTYRIKARRLKALVGWLEERCGGRFDQLFDRPTSELREDLLSVTGIGPETADCILLYAGSHPVMVIDAYTRRVMTRHGWSTRATRDEDLAGVFESEICPGSHADRVLQLQEMHALLVRLGKEHCRTRPRCEGCLLERLLPAGGPV
jgi:endonuclease-3 related protein